SPNADRICLDAERDGYCTIQGCDVSTCPQEAVCVRFFTGSFSNHVCDPTRSSSVGKPPGAMCTDKAECAGNVCKVLSSPPGTTDMACAACTQDAQCSNNQALDGHFCNLATGNCDECSIDEICAVEGRCVPRSSEIRYCMLRCDSDGDCRDNYECRDIARMK